MTRRVLSTVVSCAVPLALIAAGCGDDDDDAGDAVDTAVSAVESVVPGDDEQPDGTAGGAGGENAELCAVAQELDAQENPATAEQIERYQELAPDEIQDAAETAGDALTEVAGGPLSAFFNALAQDDVEEAEQELNAWEEENCGIPNESTGPGPGASLEVEDDANRVDVIASEYSFTGIAPQLPAGRTSFVMDNQGQEAHFMLVVRLAEGVTLEQALQSDDESGIQGAWESGLGAGGGEDEEALTLDLEPGNYGMVCFIPSDDGQPHAFKGMATPFTVG